MSTFNFDDILDWTPEERLEVIAQIAKRGLARVAVASGQESGGRFELLRALAEGSPEMLEHNREVIREYLKGGE